MTSTVLAQARRGGTPARVRAGDRTQPARSSPRAVALYLGAIRPILSTATEARQMLIQRVGVLLEDARHGSPAAVLRTAGRIGREHVGLFRDSTARLDRLSPPPGCDACHRALQQWLGALSASCQALIDAELTAKPGRVHETHEHLATARSHARHFNHEYGRLITELRYSVALAKDRSAEAAAATARPASGRTSAA